MTARDAGSSSFFTFAGVSDVGRKRKNNEDSFGAYPDAGLFFVADGMGGGDDGEIASSAVIQAIEKCAKALSSDEGGYAAEDVADAVGRAVNEASEWIFRRAEAKHLKGCGSTVVGFFLDRTNPGGALAMHAGDSRLYRIRGGSIRQITKDHSAAELIGAKDERRVNPIFRGMVLRAVGVTPAVALERTQFDVKPGDCVLVCSDGLSRMVPDKEIRAIVERNTDAESAAAELIGAANAAGGADNVTVVLVFVGDLPEPAARKPMPEAVVEPDAATSDTNEGQSSATDGATPSSGGLLPTDDDTAGGDEGDTTSTQEAPSGDVCAARIFERRARRIRTRRRVLRILAALGAVALAAAIAASGALAWRAHKRRRARMEEEIRGEVERRQELMRRQERERSEEIRRAAEKERASAEERRRSDDEERRLAQERERARRQAIRDEAERRSAEEARVRTERRRLEEERRRSQRALGTE